MLKFYKLKPGKYKAYQWLGEHDEHITPYLPNWKGGITKTCNHCGIQLAKHGWLSTSIGGHVICIGDFIITDAKSESFPCKPIVFYEIFLGVKVKK